MPDLRGLDRRRTSEVEALSEVDAVLLEERERLGVLDSLGDRLVAEALGQADDRLDEVLVAGLAVRSRTNSMSIFR